MNDLSFFNNKRVFITGHTGFMGSWLCHLLVRAGAHVTGYALAPPTNPNLFELSGVEHKISSVVGDIRNLELLEKVFCKIEPEIVFHLAAQAIVRDSYRIPHYTYETNVIGTVNILECIRKHDFVRSCLNVTTDKVYENKEWERGYRENDPIDGHDPYSNSKSCAELVIHSYKKSFFFNRNVAISTARIGNVIGGGDFASERIIPDCVRAIERNKEIIVRTPYSIRPYQHVLDPLYSSLLIAQKQYENTEYSGCYNMGPEEQDCITTGELVTLFCDKWGNDLSWSCIECNEGLHEANILKIDSSRLKQLLDWKPRWKVDKAVEKTVEWTKAYLDHRNIHDVMNAQIQDFLDY